jgi:hypothetical protein
MLALGLVIAVLFPLGLSADAQAPHEHSSAINTPKARDFQNAMRKLWEDHITWTRLLVVSATSGLPDKDATTKRLLQNQVDIGDAVKSFYRNAAGDKVHAAILRMADMLSSGVVDQFPEKFS